MTEVFNRNGGLTLIPLPGYEDVTRQLKELIEKMTLHDARGELTSTVDIAYPEYVLYDNGEPDVYLGKDHVVGHDCFIIGSGPGTPLLLAYIYDLVSVVGGRDPSRYSIFFGYLPMSRSDKNEGKKGFVGCRRFIDTILDRAKGHNFKRILASDLHSPQITGFARDGVITDVTFMRPLLSQVYQHAIETELPIVTVFPDAGSNSRYRKLAGAEADRLGIQSLSVSGEKSRNRGDIAIEGLHGDLDAMEGALLIVVDDEIATGGTNIKIANQLRREYNPTHVWSVAAHGVLCGPAVERFESDTCPIDRIFVSDTIQPRAELNPLIEAQRLSVISWHGELAQMILYDHWNRVIREDR